MTAQRKPRPRRIAADEAHAWARNLQLGNPYAKSVLKNLAGYVNGEGCCFVSIEQQADDCDLSMDTVRKRLAWLEQVGAIVRFPQWIDVNGRRNGDGRGKRTSDEIRMLMDADPDAIEARAAGDGGPETGGSDGSVSPSSRQGLNSEQDSVSPTVALGQPSDSGKGLDSLEPEPEDSPPNPPPGGGSPEAIQGKASEGEVLPDHTWPGSDTWFDFEKAWTEPILHQNKTRGIWSALTDAERQTAITAARGYVAWRKAQRRPPAVIGAHRFLTERDAWPSFCLQAAKAEQIAQQAMVPVDSPQGRAWRNLRKIGGAGTPWESNGCYLLPRPLTPQEMAFADIPGHRGEFLESGIDVQQLGAWSEFLSKSLQGLPRKPLCEDHGVGEKRRHGCYVPWPYPPRKDGSLSTAPPQDQLTNEDQDALVQC